MRYFDRKGLHPVPCTMTRHTSYSSCPISSSCCRKCNSHHTTPSALCVNLKELEELSLEYIESEEIVLMPSRRQIKSATMETLFRTIYTCPKGLIPTSCTPPLLLLLNSHFLLPVAALRPKPTLLRLQNATAVLAPIWLTLRDRSA
jgi:hypothetical protein